MSQKFIEIDKIFKLAFENGLIFTKHPIAIADGKNISVYDGDQIKDYKLVKESEFPFEMPPMVQASFTLEFYDNKSAAVLGKDVFSTTEDFITILHEFVHCYQWETCELDIKEQLKIYDHYKSKKDGMWELNHSFPYENEKIIALFEKYFNELSYQNIENAMKYKKEIADNLSDVDYEYMVWQEWKEGYARFIENRILELMNMTLIKGYSKLQGRVSFYDSGALNFDILLKDGKGSKDLKGLFKKIGMTSPTPHP
ncbi:MAG: hypothetical protein KAS62_03950 [Candidatus Delongbacteria bacterium]|nr:hypothetical protein [Candidatus Delongbacteria bacterium]